ncbi:MAG: NAD(P)/FAD-dependent oxidoreductase [Pseudolabrys sp.]|nr:NAD(P)/FAD-dependent oxidoreductase [Pseudolabrys sp.]
MIETDVVVIGAGPAGLFAVFECGQLRMRCCVIDPLAVPGGQCAALYPEKPIYDIPGHLRIDGEMLVKQLVAQSAQYEPVYRLGEVVTSLIRQDTWWLCATDKGTEVRCRVVIIAAGAGAFSPVRPQLPGIDAYENSWVRYWVSSREDFRGRRVVIAGGGDSAIDWALSLSELAETIYLVHRRAQFRAAPQSVAKLEQLAAAGKVELVIPYQLKALEGGGGTLKAVVVETLDGDTRRLEADFLIPLYGLSASLGPIVKWGLDIDQKRITVDPFSMETSLQGVFAIGDVASYPRKLKLILTGFAEAATAAHTAFKYVFPDEILHFEYSTTKGTPGLGADA